MEMVDGVFEVSSEAGRKIGGIYTVLRSKSSYFVKQYGDNYICIGYFQDFDRIKHEYIEEQPPESFRRVFGELAGDGIIAHYGRWVKGNNARIIYLDVGRFVARHIDGDIQANLIKGFLWSAFGIDSLGDTSDFTEYVGWAYATGMLIEKLLSLPEFKGKSIIAQFHEWLSGAGLLYLTHKRAPCGTVWTTHATTLGRTLSLSGRDPLLEAYNAHGAVIPREEAYRYRVNAKHQLEVACAANADVFTTVSETVGIECQYILGKKPDVITLNGFDFEMFGKKAQTRDKSAVFARNEILDFLHAYFTPYYHTELNDALVLYITARYEFINKGFDVYIEALGRVNQKVRGGKRRMYAFIFAPTAVNGPKNFIVSNALLYKKIEQMLSTYEVKGSVSLRERMLKAPPSVRARINEMLTMLRKEGETPPICAYNLTINEMEDPVVRACLNNGLTNREEDVVKVIFYPTYVSIGDGLLSMTYYDLIGGTDIGVFPSRYEPYGLTPVEAGAKENIAITSDTTGFGRFIADKIPKDGGVYVISMLGKPQTTYVAELASILEDLYRSSSERIAQLKSNAYDTMTIVDWKHMVPLYYEAYALAEKRAKQRR